MKITHSVMTVIACFLLFASNAQDISVAKLVELQKQTLGDVDDYLTHNGWTYKSSVPGENSGVVWGKYDANNVQSVLGFETMNTSNGLNMKKVDSTCIMVGTFSSDYYTHFMDEIKTMPYGKPITTARKDGLQKDFQSGELNSHIVAKQGKDEKGNVTYVFYILSIQGYFIWFLDNFGK